MLSRFGKLNHKFLRSTRCLQKRTLVSAGKFVEQLAEANCEFYTGVPDSVLGSFCAYIQDNAPPENHIMTGNEGQAVALAAGYHIGTGKTPLVYLQNSGIGNIINPIMSLAHNRVYQIPMFLLIGWRGEPGKVDEPQHIVKGQATCGLLKSSDIPYDILPENPDFIPTILDKAQFHFKYNSSPYAILVPKGAFEKYKCQEPVNTYPLLREHVIEHIIENVSSNAVVVGTTGFASRELYEIRAKLGQGHHRDFLSVGCMGHASAIAVGLATAQPSRNVYLLDGDGASLMHMGGYQLVGGSGLKNLKHVLLNNGCHESTGAQPSAGYKVDWPTVARGCGYETVFGSAETASDIEHVMSQMEQNGGPSFVEIKIGIGARKDLGRPKTTPRENKLDLMKFVSSQQPIYPQMKAY